MKDGWDMRVLALGDISSITDGVVKKGGRPEERWYLTPNIPVKEPPAALLALTALVVLSSLSAQSRAAIVGHLAHLGISVSSWRRLQYGNVY